MRRLIPFEDVDQLARVFAQVRFGLGVFGNAREQQRRQFRGDPALMAT